MTHVKALQAGHSSQGTSEPITPAYVVWFRFWESSIFTFLHLLKWHVCSYADSPYIKLVPLSSRRLQTPKYGSFAMHNGPVLLIEPPVHTLTAALITNVSNVTSSIVGSQTMSQNRPLFLAPLSRTMSKYNHIIIIMLGLEIRSHSLSAIHSLLLLYLRRSIYWYPVWSRRMMHSTVRVTDDNN